MSIQALDLDRPLLEHLEAVYAGYGGAKPLVPVPADCPNHEKLSFLLAWTGELLENCRIAPARSDYRTISMGLGRGTALHNVPDASAYILEAKSEFFKYLAVLNRLHKSLSRIQLSTSVQAHEALDRAYKAMTYIAAVQDSIRDPVSRVGWIDPREADFIEYVSRVIYP